MRSTSRARAGAGQIAVRSQILRIQLELAVEAFPIAGRFVISRGAKTEARVVVATLRAGDAGGRGECVPYARYGESVESVVAAIRRLSTSYPMLDRRRLLNVTSSRMTQHTLHGRPAPEVIDELEQVFAAEYAALAGAANGPKPADGT